MNIWSKHIVFSLYIFFTLSVKSTTIAPTLLRACLDRTTGILTVYMVPTVDGCGSFVSHELYGRDNAANPFTKLATLGTNAATQIVAPLPNKKKWELYLATLYACNGTDTLFSNTVFIDDQPPTYIEPDSVSVDFITQQIRVGWSKSPEPDVMGYSIFKIDPTTGNNLLIDEQSVLTYLFLTSTFNSINPNHKIEIAAYDSCKNGGVISNFHSPVCLSFNTPLNANYLCTKQLHIKWTAYVGWPISSYDVYVWDSKSNTWKLDGTVNGSTLNYIYAIPNLGENYNFYIRAHKSIGSITSSSNVVKITLANFSKPLYNMIGHVSVIDNNTIEVTGTWEPNANINKAVLQTKPYGTSAWSQLYVANVSAGKLLYIDKGKTTNYLKYDYRILLYNSCNVPYDSSAIHTNILLTKSLYALTWNDYWAWKNSTYNTNLNQRARQGSTWNTKNTEPDSSYILADTAKPECYRVASILKGINNKSVDTTWSNEICLRAFDTTLIPGGFTPGGINPTFLIINPNIQLGEARMQIYNRWGAKIFDGDALTGWDGKDGKEEYVGPGFYPYLVSILRPESRETYKGVVMVLR